jgi:hypothetical protein
MAEISKQALKVANNTSFPDNNVGDITPSDLRGFNTDVIDSTVNQTTFNDWSASVTSSIQQLSAFTASQQPSFAALNNFTASQLNINTGLNAATYSLDARLDSAESNLTDLNTWSQSVNQISDNGIVQGYSTRLHFYGLVSASIVPNVNGAIASILIEQDGTKANTASFNSFTASTDQQINSLEEWSASAKISIQAFGEFTASYGPVATGSLVQTSSFSGNTITFTKGNGSTYTNSGILSTASFNAYTASAITSLNDFTASQNTKNTTLAAVTQSLIVSQSTDYYKWLTLGLLTGSFATTGSNSFVGSQRITGSVSGNTTALTITGGATTMDMSVGNFFTLTLASAATTTLSVTNASKGQTVNLIVTQPSPTTGSLILSGIQQPQNNIYTASAIAGAKDIITLITFDTTSSVFATAVKNLV